MSGDRPQTIEDWRREIDELNERLLQLLNDRARCALEIGRLKHASGQPIRAPERETAVLENLKKNNPGPFTDAAVLRVFQAIIDESRRLEQDDAEEAKGDHRP